MLKRNTKQKTAIIHVLQEAKGPLSIQQILSLASDKVDGLGIATVYRNLKSLLEEGQIKVASLPNEVLCYESVQKWKQHHHHFKCNQCANIFDINICDSDFSEKVPHGFTVSSHDVMLYGICDSCKS